MRIALFNSINVNYFVDQYVRLSQLLAKITLVAIGIFSAIAVGVYLYRHSPLNIVTTEDLGNGRFKKTDRNGIIEEGVFVNGKLEGEGTRLFPGDEYEKIDGERPKKMEGTFRAGKLDGQGEITFINKKQYTGTFAEGLLIQGKKMYPAVFESTGKGMGSRYEFQSSEEGTFVNEQLHGNGRRIFDTKTWLMAYPEKGLKGPKMMEGPFKNGKLDGLGEITFIDGRQYTGTFSEGLLIQGKKTYPTDLVSTEEESVPLFEFQSEEGTFFNEQLHGDGIRCLKDGTPIAGVFSKGQLCPPPDFNVTVRNHDDGLSKSCPISLQYPISVLFSNFIGYNSESSQIFINGKEMDDHHKTIAECMDELNCKIEQDPVFSIFRRY